MENKDIADMYIVDIMQKPFPIVHKNTSIDAISKLITKDNQAVIVDLGDQKHHIITKYDIIKAIN